MPSSPKPFERPESGAFLHGTKADLEVGDLLVPGRYSNYEEGRVMNHVYVTKTLDAAVWGAEFAKGDGRCRIYLVEPVGAVEDDPNVTDKKFPGNLTRSYRSSAPLRVIREVHGWTRLTPQALATWRERLAAIRDDEHGEIIN
jgi:rifampin ADP-ribosylating transferase